MCGRHGELSDEGEEEESVRPNSQIAFLPFASSPLLPLPPYLPVALGSAGRGSPSVVALPETLTLRPNQNVLQSKR